MSLGVGARPGNVQVLNDEENYANALICWADIMSDHEVDTIIKLHIP